MSEYLSYSLRDSDSTARLNNTISQPKRFLYSWNPRLQQSLEDFRFYLETVRPQAVVVGAGAHFVIGGNTRDLGSYATNLNQTLFNLMLLKYQLQVKMMLS
jgi:hypothetical protein